MKFFKYFLILFCLIYFQTNEVYSQQISFPEINSRVTDNENILTSEEVNLLTEKLDNFYKNTSVDFIVVFVKSLEGFEIRNYAIELLEKIKPGKKDKDNGVLLLVSIAERKVSIEVGYSLEGDLTDAKSSSIIRNIILPNFKIKKYFLAIDEAINEVINIFEADSVNKKENINSIPIWILIPFLIFIFVIINKLKNQTYYVGSRRHPRYPTYFGGFGGGFGGSSRGWSGGGGSFGGGGASGSW